MAVIFSHPILDPLVARAKEIIYKSLPDLFFITKNYRVVYCDTIPAPACLSKAKGKNEFIVMFNHSQIIEDLEFGFDALSMAALFLHESGHLVYGHLYWFEQNKLMKKISDQDHRDFNMACDYIINDSIPIIFNRYDYFMSGRGGKIIQGGCLSPKIHKFPEIREVIDSGKSVRDLDLVSLMNILRNNADNKNKNEDSDGESGGESRDGGNGEGHDHSGGPSEEDKRVIGELESPASRDIEGLIEKALKESKEHKRGSDSQSGGIAKALSDFRKRQSNDVSDEILSFYQSVKSRHYKKTWSIPNRKYGYKAAGRKPVKESRIGIVWDVSGSFFNDTSLEFVMGHISNIKDHVDDVVIVTGDVEKKSVISLRGQNFCPKQLEVTGGGSSNLNFGPRVLKEYDVDAIFVITDGDIDPYDDQGIPTAFILPVDNGKIVPGFKCIFVS